MSRAAKGRDCKSFVLDFVGSSPTSPTKFNEAVEVRVMHHIMGC